MKWQEVLRILIVIVYLVVLEVVFLIISPFFTSKLIFFFLLVLSTVIIIGLSGLRISFKSKSLIDKTLVSFWGPIKINHSHHTLKLRGLGHEVKIGTKYFCIGCYGVLLGTIISVLFMVINLIIGLNPIIGLIYLVLGPICFIPIVMRYVLNNFSYIKVRIIANILLPIGCTLIFIVLDYMYKSFLVNTNLLFLLLLTIILRSLASSREHKKIELHNNPNECKNC